MITALRQRTSSEQGFTLVELFTIVLIIGVLAAIAFPAFIGQRSKGQDSSVKSDLRNAVGQIEECFTDTEDYTAAKCVAASEESGLRAVEMTPLSPTGGYVVSKVSTSGNRFSLKHAPSIADERTCTITGTPKGGCTAGRTW